MPYRGILRRAQGSRVQLPGEALLQAIVVGLVLGSIYALAASGLVITYQSTGILNFAFGSMAYFIARCYYFFHIEKEWGILLSAGVCLFVVAPAMGLVLYFGLFRFLALSSQLIKVVATIGLSVMLPAVSNIIFGNATVTFAFGLAPYPPSVYDVFGVAVTLNDVIAYACVLTIVVIGALVLRFTNAGLSVRAMVDSRALTSLSGMNPSRIAAAVWVVATFLAGLAGILAAPVINLDAGTFTLLIAAAFAAVIAARMRSITVAVVVGVLMGIAGSLVRYYLPPDSELTGAVLPSIPFVFILVSLVVNIIRLGRVSETDGVGGALDRAITPQGGSRLAASVDADTPFPKVNFAAPIVVFALVCLLPLVLAPYWLTQFALAATLAVIFLAITLVTGEGGMLWLCQITFAGVGAIATGQLVVEHGIPLIPSILIGGLIAAAIGVVIGLLTIRLGNLYVALVTLTFGLLMDKLVFSLDVFSHDGAGVAVPRPGGFASEQAFAYFALGVFGVIAIFIVNLRRSTTGLALNAVRWSENASRTMGLSVLQMKVLIGGLAAFVAGIGGGLYASDQKQAVTGNWATLLGLIWLVVLVTFGIRSNIAALLAALAFVMSPALLDNYLNDSWAQLPVVLFGIGAIMLAKNPSGTVHVYAMGFQRALHKLSGARAVPAETAFTGRHDLRLPAGPVPAENGDTPSASEPTPPAEVPR